MWLVSKIAIKGISKDVTQYLNDSWFAVVVSDGVEVILHNVNRVLRKQHIDVSLTMFVIDFTNAFNQIDRSTL